MGRMKDFVNEIIDMFHNGYDAEDISIILDIPINQVEYILQDFDNTETNNMPY